jgi:hypothetical protein
VIGSIRLQQKCRNNQKSIGVIWQNNLAVLDGKTAPRLGDAKTISISGEVRGGAGEDPTCSICIDVSFVEIGFSYQV